MDYQSNQESHVAVNLDISVYPLACKYISLDIQDSKGRLELDEHDQKEFIKV